MALGCISGSARRSEVKNRQCLLPVNHAGLWLIWRPAKVAGLTSASQGWGVGGSLGGAVSWQEGENFIATLIFDVSWIRFQFEISQIRHC